MKTVYRILTISLGFSVNMALAQLHPPPHPFPDMPAQSSPSAPSSGSDSATSGSSGTSSTSSPEAATGAGDIHDSSGASGMHSEAGAELRPPPSPVAHLQPQIQEDVTYLCGGVGAEEASYMKKQASGYDLMLTFAARDGSYLADVDVDIKDAKGNDVLQTSCDGPILLVDLPKSGTYRIHAEAAGYTLDKTAKVHAKKEKGGHVASLVLSWPQQVAEAPSTPATSTGSSGNGNTGHGGER